MLARIGLMRPHLAMPIFDSITQLLEPGETALCLFTDGRLLTFNEDGSASSGDWKLDPARSTKRAIVYKWSLSEGERIVELFSGEICSIKPAKPSKPAKSNWQTIEQFRATASSLRHWEFSLPTHHSGCSIQMKEPANELSWTRPIPIFPYYFLNKCGQLRIA